MNGKFVLAASLIAFAASTVWGAAVTVSLTGHVSSVLQFGVTTGVHVGDKVTWTAIYDVTSPDDFVGGPGLGPYYRYDYRSTPASVETDIVTSGGTLSFFAGPSIDSDPLSVWVDLDAPYNFFEITGFNTTDIDWPALIPGSSNDIDLSMQGSNLLDGTTVPSSGLPDLSRASAIVGRVRGEAPTGPQSYDVQWVADPVPEPATGCLAGLGFLLLAVRRRRPVLEETAA